MRTRRERERERQRERDGERDGMVDRRTINHDVGSKLFNRCFPSRDLDSISDLDLIRGRDSSELEAQCLGSVAIIIIIPNQINRE